MQVILGGGGAIGLELAKELKYFSKKIRIVGRNPQKVNESDEIFVADLTQKKEFIEAVKDCDVAYLTVGLPYKTKVWQLHLKSLLLYRKKSRPLHLPRRNLKFTIQREGLVPLLKMLVSILQTEG